MRLAIAAALVVGVIGDPVNPTQKAAADVPGLVAAYGFEEASGTAVLDASASGLSGLINGASRNTGGRFGSALSFDGVNDSVSIPDSVALDLTTGMTLEAWINPTSLTSWRTVLLKERPNGLSYALYASGDVPRPNTYITTAGGERFVFAPSGLTANSWIHLASTYDGTTLRLFVNGIQVATQAESSAISASANPLKIGGNSIWSEWFSGLIDEVRVYNRALTPGEIQNDMATPVGPGQEPPPPPPPPNASTVGHWTGPVELGLVAVSMVQLHTGKILMFRGMNAGGTSATVYDPVTDSKKSVPAPYNLFCSGHTQLADGRILVVGGHDSANGGLGIARAVIFDPVSETWTPVPSMSQRRWYPTATTLPDGRVLVTSGAMTNFNENADIPEIYDPATNSWTQLTAARLAFPWYPYSFVLPDGKVLIAGAGERLAPTRVLDVGLQQWTTIEPGIIDGGSAVMFAPGKVMKSGTAATTDESNVPTATTTYVLDMTQPSPAWRQTAPMARPRAYHTLTPLPDGTIIVTGGGVTTEGKNVSAAVYEAEIWSPTTETWTTMSSMQTPRLYHGTGMLLPDARVMVAGSGDSYGGPDQTTAEFFEPPYLFKGPRPTMSGVPSVVTHGSSFGATVTGTIAKVSLERLGAITHQFDENARHVDLVFEQQGNQLSMTAPANANLAPPGYYMLFAVSSDGVPSVAQMVRLPLPAEDSVAPSAPTNVIATGGLGRVDLSWTASTDNVGVIGYDIHRSTTAGFTPSTANRIGQTTTALTYADIGLIAGTYYYRIVARDAGGNASTASAEASDTAVGDTAPPTVSLTAPLDGATVSGSVTIAATASDNVGVAGVQFRVDGVNLGTMDTSSPYSVAWNSATVSNGPHAITAVARDASTNEQTSAPATVTVSNTAPPAPTGLVGAWSFNAGFGVSASDSSDSANHGLVSGATWAVAGKFGGALSFDGVNDRVDIPDKASLDLTTGMTLEAWVRPTTASGWDTVLIKERPGGLSYSMYSSNDMGRPETDIRIGADRLAAAPAALPVNQWSHLAATYNGSTLQIYVDGLSVGSQAQTGAITTSNNALRIGGNAVWGEWYSGLIDEVRIYNRALTAAEVQSDMITPIGASAPPDVLAPSAPGALTTTSGVGRVDLAWSAASDNVAVTGYSVHRSTAAGFLPSASNKIGETTTTISYADTGLATGTYYYQVTAKDAAGNVGPPSNEASGSSLADTLAPTVSVTQPANGSTVSATVSAAATANDNVGVVGVQFRLDGTTLGGEDTTAPYQVSWNTTGATNGIHVLEAVAHDAAGNVTTSGQVTVTVSNAPPDTAPPTVSITQPVNGATVSGTVTVAATASDNVGVVGVQFRLDGTNLGVEDSAAQYQTAWNTTGTSNGSHILEAVARDAAGNVTTSGPVTVTVSNTPPPPPVGGLVGAWSFNAGTGTAVTDSSTAANNGTLSGATWAVAGRFGGALSFDGVNDRVNIPDKASLDLTTGMTLEAWVRPTTASGWDTVVIKERPGGLSYSMYSSNDMGRPETDIRIGADRLAAAPVALPVNQWSHLAATYNGSTLQIYVDGLSVGSQAQTGAITTSNNALRIGGNAVWGEWYSGLIDEVRIYNRALTATEIQTDMITPIG